MPLPMAAHWSMGVTPGGFDPAYQMRMIAEGHHLLPWFQMPDPAAPADTDLWIRYYETPIKEAARLGLPISLVGTQWESLLTYDKRYFELPPERNPNVVGTDGVIQPKVSPFGPVQPWRDVGRTWTSSPLMRKLQEWYPDPPLVVVVSNNEHSRLAWTEVEEDRRYLETFGRGKSDDFEREVVAKGWITRYRALQEGMRQGLEGSSWRDRAIFIGYDAFGPPHFARWERWKVHSLYVPGGIDSAPLMWDGGSPSFYVFNWNDSTDYTVHSPQIEAMNWVFMQTEAERLNPRFRFEISVWDGNEPDQENDKRKLYARLGQTFGPDRYGGMVQFGMWLLRPRVVREFRGWQDTRERSEPYFLRIVDAVDRVHRHAILARFWRRGSLVANRKHQHPYQTDVPPDYRDVDRWFLLDTDLDPPRPWSLETGIPVFSLALVLGEPPARQWLVYAHAPLGLRGRVRVEIPDYRQVEIDASVAGSFFLFDERDASVQPID